MATMQVDLVARDKKVWSGESTRVSVATVDGSMGILPNMAPTLSVLREGEVKILTTSGETEIVKVSGGFVSVDQNTVTVLIDDVL